MGKHQIFKDGKLISEIEAEEDFSANWAGLKAGLWNSTAFLKVLGGIVSVNPIAFNALSIVLTDGENKGASQSSFFRMFAALSADFSETDLAEINAILQANNFSGEV